jgi:hypothetical protein
MDKILLLGLLLVLIVFIIISFNQECKFVENRVNNNIDKKEDFEHNSITRFYVIPDTCPVCSVLRGGVCEPKYCPFGKRCQLKDNIKKGIKAGMCA